jgi:Lrp/AsnC family leucine-responsive transcriptional regulator
MIDEIDQKILEKLQENARISNAQIARELNLAPSGILERIRKLERRGIIKGYRAELDAGQVGYCVTAYLMVKTDDRVGSLSTAERLAKIKEVLEVHHVAGEDCYLVKLKCSGNEELGRLLRDKIGAIKSIRSSRTSVVLETIKETYTLPVKM